MKNDITLFAKIVLPKHVKMEFAECHQELFKILNAEHPKKCVIFPRGIGKSTIASLIYPLYRICYSLEKFIVITSESYQQSVMFLESIKDELEFNERLKALFGDLRNPEKWSEGEIETTNGIKIMAKGSRQKHRGLKYGHSRVTLEIMDDFESESNTETPELREKIKRWVDGAVLPSLDAQGSIIFIGTIVHQDSYLNSIREDPNYLTNDPRFHQIIDDGWEKSLWPERWSVKGIKQLRDEYDRKGYIDLFYQEFMNQPMSPDSQLFKPKYIAYWDGEIVIDDGGVWLKHTKDFKGEDEKVEYLATFFGVDPAMGKVRGDYTVIMVIGVSAEGKVYVLEYVRSRIAPTETIEEIFRLYNKYKPRRVTIETTAFQEVLAENLRNECKKRNIWISVNEIKPRKSKAVKFSDRLTGLEPRFRQKFVLLNRDHKELYQELISFPLGKSDDCIDGLYNSIDGSYPPERKTYSKDSDYKTKPKETLSWKVR